MTKKDTKRKELGTFAKSYLVLYNFIQIIGWSTILYQVIIYHTSRNSEKSLWDTVKVPVIIFQHAALLEVVHAAIKIVPSNPGITFIQILSRIMVVVGALIMTPENYATSSIGLPMELYCWSLAEIIRYSYYFMNLIGSLPSILVWLRYTMFIILYPLGITGELLCLYAAVQYGNDYPDAWSYRLPNSFNFIFSYKYVLILTMLTYIPGFPFLYKYMLTQRRKILGSPSTKKAE